MTPLLTATLAAVVCGADAGAGARTVAFYHARPTGAAPKLDGRLDEPCWADAQVARTYYQYWKADPDIGVLDTEFRMAYDAHGIYLGIVNHDKHTGKLRATKTTRDDPSMWTDDCAEIYFDPAAMGIAYGRFVVNSLGTQQDSKRIDTGVTLGEWSGDGWQAKTRVGRSGWTIEAFFPWSDLGQRATAGDLWQFDHVRYAYTSGGFQGVTWSPGGNYQSPDKFGYVYFGRDRLARDKVARLLSARVRPPWQLLTTDGFVVCTKPGQVTFAKPADMVARERAAVSALLAKTEPVVRQVKSKAVAKAFGAVKDGYAKIPEKVATTAEAFTAVREMAALKDRIDEVYWQARVQALVDRL